MDYLLLYLILRLDALSSTISVLAGVTGCLFIIASLFFILNPEETNSAKLIRNNARPWLKGLGIPFVIAGFLTVMTPDTKQAAVIYCLPKIVNNEQVQKIPEKLLDLSNTWLDEKIEGATNPIIEAVEN